MALIQIKFSKIVDFLINKQFVTDHFKEFRKTLQLFSKKTYIRMEFYALCHTDKNVLSSVCEKGGNVQRIRFLVIYRYIKEYLRWIKNKNTRYICIGSSRLIKLGNYIQG